MTALGGDEGLVQLFGEGRFVVGGNEVAGLPVSDELGCAADGGGDAVQAAGHGFLEGAGGAFGL